jgi:hypothetical protein
MVAIIVTVPAAVQAQTVSLTVTAKDVGDALNAANKRCYISRVQPGIGNQSAVMPECQQHGTGSAISVAAPGGSSSPPFFYPADVINNGGPVVANAQFSNLYLNSSCTPVSSCWGDPAGFMSDLFAGGSTFIHITDQYANATANSRYTVNTASGSAIASEPHIMQETDVQAAVIAGVRALNPAPGGGGGGYNHAYNLFLPQGQDTCFTGGTVCYSPDNAPTFYFCAYHASLDSTDSNGSPIHVLYTVIPYQNVPGCQVTNPPFPNSQLIDSTNNVLSHEIFELISDPDGTAWWVSQLSGVLGEEIGDICGWELQKFNINGKPYDTQLEYDNVSHGCASKTIPPGVICFVALDKTTYSRGDVITASTLKVTNPTASPVPFAYDLWFDIPGSKLLSFVRGGSDGSVISPPGTQDYSGMVVASSAQTSGAPVGSYNFGCRLLDPVTGGLQSEKIVPFSIQ